MKTPEKVGGNWKMTTPVKFGGNWTMTTPEKFGGNWAMGIRGFALTNVNMKKFNKGC